MNAPTDRSRVPEFLYWLLALIGCVGTQLQFPYYISAGFFDGTLSFFRDSVVNPATTFLLVDIFVLAAAVLVWAFGEARRLHMRGIWFYVLASLLIGVSTFAPAFMAMRERRLREVVSNAPWVLRGTDWMGVALLVAAAVGTAVYSLSHIPT